MGFAVDIFRSQPPACYECAVCHDVLQSAVSFKECGHSFCEECAKACLRSKTCPNCRVEVTGLIPNFIVREAIGSMEVKCPNGGDESNKRARGNDGEAVPVSADGCDWTGKCYELQNHEKVCGFKIIRCSIDGCNHECLRKDMNGHLSGGDGFLRHMNLMKQSITASYEAKMKSMHQSYVKSHDKMSRKYDAQFRNIRQSYLNEVGEVKKSYDKKLEDMKQSIIALEDEIQKSLPPEAAAAFAKALKKRHLGTDDNIYYGGDSDSDNDVRVRVSMVTRRQRCQGDDDSDDD
eukprot:scaffold51375_cov37-Cyclotella_meneghiniana.AAC.1